jgi:hypothetical protein
MHEFVSYLGSLCYFHRLNMGDNLARLRMPEFTDGIMPVGPGVYTCSRRAPCRIQPECKLKRLMNVICHLHFRHGPATKFLKCGGVF